MLRGTLPKAAWCSTTWLPSTAFRQVSKSRISPWIKWKLGKVRKGSMLRLKPVERLSRQVTSKPSFKKYSQRLDPINPAPPVMVNFVDVIIFNISQVFAWFLYCLNRVPSVNFVDRLMVGLDKSPLPGGRGIFQPTNSPSAIWHAWKYNSSPLGMMASCWEIESSVGDFGHWDVGMNIQSWCYTMLWYIPWRAEMCFSMP